MIIGWCLLAASMLLAVGVLIVCCRQHRRQPKSPRERSTLDDLMEE